ncbi:MAG: hypothetical protein KC503_19240 [Myxococcales bacterium]|nr:hypothetical protein [Myxococcales bacterium]
MFSLPGILGLVTFLFVRPQEVWTGLQVLPLIYLFFGLAVFGMVVDFRLRLVKPRATPQLPWVAAFAAWCIMTASIKAQSLFSGVGHDNLTALDLAILLVWYSLTAHGIQSFRVFKLMALVVVGLTAFLTILMIHQRFSPYQCAKIPEDAVLTVVAGIPDGRPCKTARDCLGKDAKLGADYLCERAGLMQAHSIGGRVRYRGVLQDPNELCLALAWSLPFLFAFWQIKREEWLKRLMIVMTAAVMLVIVFTQSRGGQLATMAMFGAYVIYKMGWKGVAMGGFGGAGILALMLLKGGRSDSKASTLERLECYWEGMTMFRSSPLIGVGFGQFTAHHHLTAHNSYILAPAELGAPGTYMFLGIIYQSFRIGLTAIKKYSPDDPDGRMPHYFGLAIVAAFTGVVAGILFLSFNYHYLLWWYFGLAGALYQAIKRHDPSFNVKFTVVDFFKLFGITVGTIAAMFGMTRIWPPH